MPKVNGKEEDGKKKKSSKYWMVLCREEESTTAHGHITSLSVARTHRKLGLATKLMNAARAF